MIKENPIFKGILDTVKTKPIYVLDTETSGFDPKNNDVLQVSIIKVVSRDDGKTLSIEDSLNVFIKGTVLPEAEAINHLSQEFIDENGLSKQQAVNVIRSFFPNDGVFCGHNAPFDEKMMKGLYEKVGEEFSCGTMIDTLDIMKRLVRAGRSSQYKGMKPEDIPVKPGVEPIPNHKLITCCKWFGINTDDVAFHDSRADILQTMMLLEKQVNYIQDKLAEEEEAERKLAAMLGTDEVEKTVPVIQSASYWEKGMIRRVYVNCDVGKIYYDCAKKCWFGGTADLLMKVDMNGLKKAVYTLAGSATNDDEMVANLKAKKKAA